MVRRPWQIWSLFGLCLLVTIPAMSWLTTKALELDAAQVQARQQAELEDRISSALWRLDTRLTPILSQEAARPEFEYCAFLPDETPGMRLNPGPKYVMGTPSRLLVQPSRYVQLNFQCSANGCTTSPQCPEDSTEQWAIACGVNPSQISESRRRLEELVGVLNYESLLMLLPDQTVPDLRQWPDNWFEVGGNWGQIVSHNLANNESQNGVDNVAQTPGNSANYEGGPTRSVTRGRNDINEFNNRNSALQAYAQHERVQRVDVGVDRNVRECVSKPLWIGDRLILARRVSVGGETRIQGCWLNWDAIASILRAEVEDLLPEVTFEPVNDPELSKAGRLLATLPIELRVPQLMELSAEFSPIKGSLVIAWISLAFASLTGALMLSAVVGLSERRAAFVSAVTHELRTPLTTFRMYAEMLAENMVPVGQEGSYLRRLQTEADRLSHLVENVLQYARLERGRGGQNRVRVEVGMMLDRILPRLEERAAQSKMQIVPELCPSDRDCVLVTDQGAVEQMLFNLVDNACKYAAASPDRRIHLRVAAESACLKIYVRDHGPGIAAAARRRLFSPFSKSANEAAQTAPGVGLGLALSHRLASALGGKLSYFQAEEGGALFEICLPLQLHE